MTTNAYGFNNDRSKHSIDQLETDVNNLNEDMSDVKDALPLSEFDNVNTIDSQLAKRALCFDIVADMVTSEDLKVGIICHTSGFYLSGDGGAAWYLISDIGTANEIDVLACGDLYANLIYQDEMDVKQLGAVANADISAILHTVIGHVKTILVNDDYLLNERTIIKFNMKGTGTITTPAPNVIGSTYVEDSWYDNNVNHRPSALRIDSSDNLTIEGIDFEGYNQPDLTSPTPLLLLIVENSTNITFKNSSIHNHGRGILIDGGRNHNILVENVKCTGQCLLGFMTENSFSSDLGKESTGIVFKNCYGEGWRPMALGTGIVSVRDSYFDGNLDITVSGNKSTPMWIHSNEVIITDICATFDSCRFICRYYGVHLTNGTHIGSNIEFDYDEISFNNCIFDARPSNSLLHCFQSNNIQSIKWDSCIFYKRILTDNTNVDGAGTSLVKGEMFYTMNNCMIKGSTDDYPSTALIRGGFGNWKITNSNIICQASTTSAIIAKDRLTIENCVIKNASSVVGRDSGNDMTVISNCTGDYNNIASGANYNNTIYNFGSGGNSANGITMTPAAMSTMRYQKLPLGSILPDTSTGKLYWLVSGTGSNNVWKDAAGNTLT